MDLARAQAALRAAHLCLEQRLFDSAVNRVYFAMFQAAVWALETHGIRRGEWSHRAVHSDFVNTFVRRRKVVPLNLAGALPGIIELRHIADYQQSGASQRQAERAVRTAQHFLELLVKEVSHVPKT